MLSNKRRMLLIGVIILLTLALIGCSNSRGQPYTAKEYNQIEAGMTYDEVVGILENDGKVISKNATDLYATAAYIWQNQDGSNMTVNFQNGKVISKNQNGLK